MPKEKLPKLLTQARKFSEDFFELQFELMSGFDSGSAIKAWTRNAAAREEFAIFGMDDTGSLIGLWKEGERSLEECPVVFLGSEGQVAVLATSLPEFLALLGLGCSPYDLATGQEPEEAPQPLPKVLQWLEKETGLQAPAGPEEILRKARKLRSKLQKRLDTLRKEGEEGNL